MHISHSPVQCTCLGWGFLYVRWGHGVGAVDGKGRGGVRACMSPGYRYKVPPDCRDMKYISALALDYQGRFEGMLTSQAVW